MKSSKNILIATAVIIFAANLLSGCGENSSVSEREQAIARINEFKEVTKTVDLRLEQEVNGSRITVRAFLDNPEGKSINSAQTWISFNPDHMQGVEVNTSESPFDLPPPYNNGFDENQGLVRLGGATTSPTTAEVIQVGQIVFDLKHKGVTMLDSYDYRQDLSGHLSANTILNGTPYNLLKNPSSPLLVINQL